MDEILFYFHQGNGYFLEGEYGQAINSYTKCLKINPTEPNLYAARAICYLMNKQYYRMRSDAEILIDRFQLLDLAYYFKAISYLAEKNIQNAEIFFQKVLEVSPSNQLARNQLDTIGIMKQPINLPELFEILKDSQDESFIQLLPLINQIQNNPFDLLNYIGNPDLIICLRKVCDFNYRLPQVDYQSNNIINRFRFDNYKFSNYVQLNNNNNNSVQNEKRVDLTLFCIAKSKEFIKAKQFTLAYDFANRARENCTSSTSSEVLYIIFKCLYISLMGLGQFTSALSSYQTAFSYSTIRYTPEAKSHLRFLKQLSKSFEAISSSSDNSTMRFDKDQFSIKTSQMRPKILGKKSNSSTEIKAINRPAFQNQKEMQKDHLEQLKLAAVECLQKGAFNTAKQLYTEAISFSPFDPTLFTSRAMVYLNMNQSDLAIKDCQSALKLDPNCIIALAKMEQAYLMKQNYDMARECARKIFLIDEDNPDAILILKQAGLIHKEKRLEVNKNMNDIAETNTNDNDFHASPFSMPPASKKPHVKIQFSPYSTQTTSKRSVLFTKSRK